MSFLSHLTSSFSGVMPTAGGAGGAANMFRAFSAITPAGRSALSSGQAQFSNAGQIDYYGPNSQWRDYSGTGPFSEAAQPTNANFRGQEDIIYRQFMDSGGRAGPNAEIPIWDVNASRIVPVIATTDGQPPDYSKSPWAAGRRGAPSGLTVQNSARTETMWGVYSKYEKADYNIFQTQLYGRYGDTASETLQMHPEYYKSGNYGIRLADKSADMVDKNLSLIDAPENPHYGTPEGERNYSERRQEIYAQEMVYDPLARGQGSWGLRNFGRTRMNNLMHGLNVDGSLITTGKYAMMNYIPDYSRPTNEMAGMKNNSWMKRLHQGTYKESHMGADVAPTIKTFDSGEQRI